MSRFNRKHLDVKRVDGEIVAVDKRTELGPATITVDGQDLQADMIEMVQKVWPTEQVGTWAGCPIVVEVEAQLTYASPKCLVCHDADHLPDCWFCEACAKAMEVD